jgi:hypothetical protein
MITAIKQDDISIVERNLDRSMCITNYVEFSVVDKVKKTYRYVKYTNSKKSLIEKWAVVLDIFGVNDLENVSVKRAIEHQLLKKFPLAIYYPPIAQTSP